MEKIKSFFIIHLQKKKYEINNYSFNLYQNNLCLISKEKESNNKLLLCACKKYIESQKNGILLLIIELNNKISEKFYDTGIFEVYCFCQICRFENPNRGNMILSQNQNNDNLIGTEYFLVGGFDPNKKKGLIKLYQINYNNDKFELTNIEYIQDIEIKESTKFKGFEGAITCIIQSKNNGDLLITSYDGNVYDFSNPNINKIKKNINENNN